MLRFYLYFIQLIAAGVARNTYIFTRGDYETSIHRYDGLFWEVITKQFNKIKIIKFILSNH